MSTGATAGDVGVAVVAAVGLHLFGWGVGGQGKDVDASRWHDALGVGA